MVGVVLVRVVLGGMICPWAVRTVRVRCVCGVAVVSVIGIVGGPGRFCGCALVKLIRSYIVR